jgi:hypothetical protein
MEIAQRSIRLNVEEGNETSLLHVLDPLSSHAVSVLVGAAAKSTVTAQDVGVVFGAHLPDEMQQGPVRVVGPVVLGKGE